MFIPFFNSKASRPLSSHRRVVAGDGEGRGDRIVSGGSCAGGVQAIGGDARNAIHYSTEAPTLHTDVEPMPALAWEWHGGGKQWDRQSTHTSPTPPPPPP